MDITTLTLKRFVSKTKAWNQIVDSQGLGGMATAWTWLGHFMDLDRQAPETTVCAQVLVHSVVRSKRETSSACLKPAGIPSILAMADGTN